MSAKDPCLNGVRMGLAESEHEQGEYTTEIMDYEPLNIRVAGHDLQLV
jgi:hypothetical protein